MSMTHRYVIVRSDDRLYEVKNTNGAVLKSHMLRGDAWSYALGRAAKFGLILGQAFQVMTDDGRTILVDAQFMGPDGPIRTPTPVPVEGI